MPFLSEQKDGANYPPTSEDFFLHNQIFWREDFEKGWNYPKGTFREERYFTQEQISVEFSWRGGIFQKGWARFTAIIWKTIRWLNEENFV